MMSTITAMPAKTNEPLYLEVENHIYDAIANGDLKPGDRLSSPEDLCQSLGVSAGTVRQALQSLASNKVLIRRPRIGTIVDPKLDLEASIWARAEGDAPEPVTRASALKSIAMIVPDVQVFDFAVLSRGVEMAAEAADVSVMMGNSDDDSERIGKLVTKFIDAGVDGLIIATASEIGLSADVVDAVRKSGLPVISCYRRIGMVDWPLVRTDGYYNTQCAVTHLLDSGRTNLAMFDFGFDETAESTSRRDGRLGFFTAMAEAGVPVDLQRFYEFPWSARPLGREHYTIRSEEVEAVANWLKNHPDVDGIVCVHDRLAAVAMQALKSLGRSVPNDVALVGFGHRGHLYGLEAEWLTSMDVHFYEIGRAACNLIIDHHQGKPARSRSVVTVRGELIAGPSTCNDK